MQYNDQMHVILDAAKARFGDVIKIVRLSDNGFFVACKRDSCPFKDRPYMTIKASVNLDEKEKPEAAFYWGHYDLTLEKMHAQIVDVAA